MDYKAIGIRKIIDCIYSSPDSVIGVRDIIQSTGASKLRVYPALFELEQAGYIKVVGHEKLEAPLAVRRRRDASRVLHDDM